MDPYDQVAATQVRRVQGGNERVPRTRRAGMGLACALPAWAGRAGAALERC